MKHIFVRLMTALFALSLGGAALAQQKGTADEAVAMVKKAGAYLKENGQDKTIAAINNPRGPFVKGDLYVFMLRTNGDGLALAHGQNAKIVGKNMLELRSADGVYFVKDFIKVANSAAGKGWVNYKWLNSVSNTIEEKSTYVERHGEVFLGVGIYK
ncbi:cache domain-containing protein [Janthinobacterium fluminis]|uniref:Cache domain-containing protein n=1 Tax=Janthinobacterium fluminis TaxID=2987524 RepID=A0ABT5K8U4_9BURK|nr:cache domain-containing protein [Janthinobacterium fluminis]MDC8760873.1 cache domain-containing protein [Janthinobacterium fluminis]